MLIEHRVDHVNERLIAVNQAVPAAQNIALQPSFHGVLAEHFHDAAVRGKLAAVGVFRKILAKPNLLANSNEAWSWLDSVSSGPNTRKFCMLSRITSRRKIPRVGTLPARVAPGFLTSMAKLRKSGNSRGLHNKPPLATGLALIRRSPFGARAFNSGISRPSLSKSSSGL